MAARWLQEYLPLVKPQTPVQLEYKEAVLYSNAFKIKSTDCSKFELLLV